MKVDESAGKITIRQGPIERFDMEEGMTMVFKANDPAILKRVKPGDKIRFDADNVTGQKGGLGPAVPLPVTGLRHLVHEGHVGATQASGVVDAVDPAKRRLTVSYGAIKSLGWPAMTMDFAVNEAIDLSAIKVGTRVNFTLVRGPNGSWVVDTLKPQ